MSSLIGLAAAAAAQSQIIPSSPAGSPAASMEKPSFPQRTSSVPVFKRDANEMLGLGSSPSAPVQNLIQPKSDWRLFLTIEERQLIRRKISAAYEAKLKSYEELLQTCAAIDEELVYISAPSRLDYFKAGLQFEKRVSEKRKQLVDSVVAAPVSAAPSPIPEAHDGNDDSSAASSGDDTEHTAKKVKFDPKRS